ncbi:MAG: MerR family transcriptional regulator [Anaerotignum sp.]|nr:MerR family transcriptional regulator [Anaerotignum sp.]
MKYSIGEFSKLTHLGIHTLRYYEDEKLIIPERNNANRRCYCEKDFAWIAFIKRLKDTGMPIKEIRHYAQLRAEGNSTQNERMEILIQHRQVLKKQIRQLKEHQAKLDEKIKFYQEEITSQNQ